MMIIFLILKTKTKTKNRTTTWQKLSRGDPELSVTHTVILSRCRIISVKFSKGCLETHRPSPSTFIWLPLLQCLRERVQSCELQCPDTNTNISVLLYRWKKKALCHISASSKSCLFLLCKQSNGTQTCENYEWEYNELPVLVKTPHFCHIWQIWSAGCSPNKDHRFGPRHSSQFVLNQIFLQLMHEAANFNQSNQIPQNSKKVLLHTCCNLLSFFSVRDI